MLLLFLRVLHERIQGRRGVNIGLQHGVEVKLLQRLRVCRGAGSEGSQCARKMRSSTTFLHIHTVPTVCTALCIANDRKLPANREFHLSYFSSKARCSTMGPARKTNPSHPPSSRTRDNTQTLQRKRRTRHSQELPLSHGKVCLGHHAGLCLSLQRRGQTRTPGLALRHLRLQHLSKGTGSGATQAWDAGEEAIKLLSQPSHPFPFPTLSCTRYNLCSCEAFGKKPTRPK